VSGLQLVVGAQTLAAMLVVSLLGLIVLYGVRHRSITFVLTATVLVPVVSLAAGVLVATALAPPRAVDRIAVPVAVAVALSIVISVVVARLIMRASVGLRRAVELLGEGSDFPAPRAPTAELSGLAAALDEAQHRLAQAREREAHLEHSRRAMLVGIGHDLRTPLARLRSVVEALQDEDLSQRDVLNFYLGVLDSQTNRLATLVDEAVELARVTSGLVEPVLAPLAVEELVSNALADSAAHAERRGVTVKGQAPAGVTVQADLRLMTRVLDNLVDNAVAETPPGGAVQIRAESGSGGVVLHIDDACGGIPEHDLPHVFEPGYRGDRTRRADRRGFGLGLAIARGIAEASGATVSADNVDGGCRFSVRFPA
jgi:signal transduction histidine kinase